MDRTLRITAGGLVVAMLVVYAAAKVHFFTRFDGDFGTYAAEHWPYTAGLVALGALLWTIGRVAARRARRRASENGDPTTR